jgi:enediyne biosynthesis protein E4
MLNRVFRRIVWFGLCAVLGCSSGDGGPGGTGGGGAGGPACDPPPASDSGAIFVEAASELGIDVSHHFGSDFCELTDTVGGPGVCLLDHDGDGDLDIFMPDRAGHPSHLYDNGGGSFNDVADALGLAQVASDTMGCLAFDYDGDGDRDLYLTNVGPDQLLQNDGGGFSDVTNAVGLDADGFSVSAAAADIDADGDLDLFVGRVVDLATCPPGCFLPPSACEPASNLLFVNDGGSFSEQAVGRGIDHPAPTLTSVWFDYDGDDDLDLYVGNDMGLMFDDRLYINDGSGSFDEKGQGEGLFAPGTDTMGADVGDFDMNGTTDVVITDFKDRPIRLFECADPALPCDGKPVPDGLEYVKWSVGFEDFDQDRDLDIFTSNGDVADTGAVDPENPSYLYFNDGTGSYSQQLPPAGSALGLARLSRGAAFGDLDRDGDVDVVIATVGGLPQVLLNDHQGGYWLDVELDSLAAGARVTVAGFNGRLTEHALIGGTYGGNNSPDLHFGLGADCVADVTVRYPDGSEMMVAGAAAGTRVRVER